MPISRIGRFCSRVCKILLGLIFRLFLARKQKPGVAGILRKQPTRCGRLKRWNAMLVLSIIIASCLHNEILMAARICQPVIQISGKEILNVGYKINQISVNESKKHQIILFQSIMRCAIRVLMFSKYTAYAILNSTYINKYTAVSISFPESVVDKCFHPASVWTT